MLTILYAWTNSAKSVIIIKFFFSHSSKKNWTELTLEDRQNGKTTGDDCDDVAASADYDTVMLFYFYDDANVLCKFCLMLLAEIPFKTFILTVLINTKLNCFFFFFYISPLVLFSEKRKIMSIMNIFWFLIKLILNGIPWKMCVGLK